MITDKKVLAIIPARGNSKGIPGKNIINFAGLPLIAHTICAAKDTRYIDAVVVSTDSLEIADVAVKYGAEVPFIRPACLAEDTSKSIDAVIHALDSLRCDGRKFDILMLLQPTQPLRTKEDIDGALELFVSNNCWSLLSVCEVCDHPVFIRTVGSCGEVIPLLNGGSTIRRQDLPLFYKINGAIYINTIAEINESTSFNDNKIAYIMEKSHSVDIDEPVDLLIGEIYCNNF
jgi:CMP-N,N'-diacetyllegionaminic acid synthase